MATFSRILVPTDFSEPADEALNYALGLAQALGATVSLVHAVNDPFDVPTPPEIRHQILSDIRRRLGDRVAQSGRADVSSVIRTGPTARAIVACAREQKADLIVMGTHGRHGMAHLLMGSVAERVVRTAECPVLTVRRMATPQAEGARGVIDTLVSHRERIQADAIAVAGPLESEAPDVSNSRRL